MPRGLVAIAGGLILLAALIGLYLGGARGKGSRYSDADVAEVVPTRPIANAQPLVTPPVDEIQVRKWAREEAQSVLGHPAVKRTATPASPTDQGNAEGPDTPLSAPTLTPSPPPPRPFAPG